ncbi:MAG: hypothetical protein QXK37_06400 [Candidatus Woesearchaeota archaeon]
MVPYSSAEVVVFEQYVTDTFLQKSGLHIERMVILKNVGSNPIIPGELHFKLHEIRKGTRVPSKVSNFFAENEIKTPLKTRMIEGNDETDLVISVWEPVLPGFTYKIYLKYDLEFDPKGFLFYEIKVPVEETTIPIRSNEHSLYLPSNYHVTYAPEGVVKKVEKSGKTYRQVVWKNRRDMLLEYSYLPLPKLGVRGVNIFWIVIIVSMVITTLLLHKKLRR